MCEVTVEQGSAHGTVVVGNAYGGQSRIARRVLVGIVLCALLATAAWIANRSDSIRVAHCLSAIGGIDCTQNTDGTGWNFVVPRDVAWTDAGGSLHTGDRPECLPPVGLGSVTIRAQVVRIRIQGPNRGTSWDQAVWVDCRGSGP